MADFARGETFLRLREDRHLTQEDAAHELQVSVKTVRNWEKGGSIRWANAKRVARFYGVKPEELVERELPEDDSARLAALEGEVSEMRLALAAALELLADQDQAQYEAALSAGEQLTPEREQHEIERAQKRETARRLVERLRSGQDHY